MEFPVMKDNWAEKHGLYKQPKKGKCRESQFANGNHRIAYVPEFCPLDGGLQGASAYSVCIDCGKRFKKSLFLV